MATTKSRPVATVGIRSPKFSSLTRGMRGSIPLARLAGPAGLPLLLLLLNSCCHSAAEKGNATLLWRASVGCHHWGSGCWIPGFSGTDSSPALSADGAQAVIGSYDGHVYSIATADGSQLWNSTLGPSLGYSAVGEGTPALVRVGGAACFIVATLHSVQCLDAETGAPRWSWTPEGGGQIASCGALDVQRQLVFAGTLHKELWALNVSDGRTVWRYEAGET